MTTSFDVETDMGFAVISGLVKKSRTLYYPERDVDDISALGIAARARADEATRSVALGKTPENAHRTKWAML